MFSGKDRVFAAAAAIMIILVAVWRIPPASIRALMLCYFEGAAAVLFAAILWRYNPWLAGFLMLALVSMYYPFYTNRSYLTFHHIFLGLVWYYALAAYLKPEYVKHILDAICIAALANVVLMALQELGLDPIFIDRISKGPHRYATGFMGNTNLASAYISLSLPAFFRKGWYWCIVPLAAAVVAASASMGFIALCLGLAIWYFSNIGRAAVYQIPIAVSLIILFFIFVDTPGTERFTPLKMTLKAYKQHWVMGSGIGHWQVVFKKPIVTKIGGQLVSSRWATLHNEPVQAMFEMGVLFPVLVAGYMWRAYRKFERRAFIPAIGVILVIVSSMGNFIFHIGSTSMLGLTWLALYDKEVMKC